ncbi:TIGR02594 family protein [Shewanella waksmanii]|uniref:TIGR02594 family protein n=1 Tax=Shewanella waksmanii TaxID=213783 RepID=UPI003735A981
MTIQLSGSVGVDGHNQANDIKTVQAALNKLIHLLAPTSKLVVDGSLGRVPANSKTVAAITQFQRKIVGLIRPDGRIDVNGRSHRALNQKLQSISSSPVAVVDTAALIQGTPWMKTALAEQGQAEIAGAVANPRILEYFKASKFWGTDDSGGENAWCGSFVAWVMQQNGYTPVSNAFRAKSWIDFGQKITEPVYGAIGIKSRQGGGHVAFVAGQSADGQSLYMLGGNQANKVQISKYSRAVWTDFVLPMNARRAGRSLPIYTASASQAGSEA